MSQMNSPVSTMFDVQRSAIEQSQDAFEQTITAQQQFLESMMDVGTAKRLNHRSFETAHAMVDAYFDALESAMPTDRTTGLEDVRGTMVDQLETAETTQTETLDAFEASVEDGMEITDETLDAFLAALDEQIEAMLEAHGDVETETLAAVEDFEASLEDLQAQVTEMQHQIEDASSEVVDSTEEMVEVQVQATGDSLESLPGLGATYAERLREQGIETVRALTEANADVVAEAADVSVKQAEAWLDAAQSTAQ